jgi:hypothetical protein
LTSTNIPATASDLWNALLKTALLGTDRTPLPELHTDGHMQTFFAQVDPSNKEKALLTAAALLSVYRSCGTLPNKATASPLTPAEPESIPRCTPGAAAYLARMLQGEFPFLIPEFLDALIASGRRIPHELLPAALAAGRKDTQIRPNLSRTIGLRGEWLASLNDDWHYIGGKIDTAEWETSSRPSRVSLLKTLRPTDPAAARQLLESTWSTDSPDDRIAFIHELQPGLSPEDEAFLETSLDDRRKEVRRKAADLLAQLPTSRLLERMQNRARALINKAVKSRLKRALSGEPGLNVRLPEVCDDSMQRDGIELTPPQGTGEKAWWLGQIAAAVPISFWNDHLQLTPTESIAEATKTDHADLLLSAWARATRKSKHSEWASAIFEYALNQKKDPQLLAVVEAVPEPQRDKLVIKLLNSDRPFFAPAQPGMSLLNSCPAPWSDSLSRAFLDLLRHQTEQSIEAKPGVATIWLPNPEQFAMKMPLTIAAQAQQSWPETLNQPVCKPIQAFLAVLEFRSSMLRQFTNQEIGQ